MAMLRNSIGKCVLVLLLLIGLAFTEFGFNVGTGLNFRVSSKLAFELGTDLHFVDPFGRSRTFVDPELGIKFRFQGRLMFDLISAKGNFLQAAQSVLFLIQR